jgi:hypothetical protein
MANMPDRMARVRPPRVLLVKFPRGSMLGEPLNQVRQRKIIQDAFKALETMTQPGSVRELPYRWKAPDPA